MGVTAEPFEQAFGIDLNEIVVADGFDREMTDWFPLSFDDRVLLAAFQEYDIQQPVGFAKNVLSFVFRKPENTVQATETKSHNAARRAEMIARHAAIVSDQIRSEEPASDTCQNGFCNSPNPQTSV